MTFGWPTHEQIARYVRLAQRVLRAAICAAKTAPRSVGLQHDLDRLRVARGRMELNPDFQEFLRSFVGHDVRFLIVGGTRSPPTDPRYTKDLDVWVSDREVDERVPLRRGELTPLTTVPPVDFVFSAEVWEHSGAGSWHFVSLPEDEADDIEEMFGHTAGGFGSIRVEVTIGTSTWFTSLFPDAKRATYVLPLKKAVRVKERLVAGSIARVELVVVADELSKPSAERRVSRGEGLLPPDAPASRDR